MATDGCPFVSRGGLKLQHAILTFGLEPRGLVCADLGCSTGGFTDCLLQAGARQVYAVDTAYGQLDWKLRNDDRVVVMERSNALHTQPPPEAAHETDLVVIDLGWTRQDKAIPAALRWASPGGRIVTLIKPHYEAPRGSSERIGKHGALDEDEAERVAREVAARMPSCGVTVKDLVRSPILGGKTTKGASKGNTEWLALLEVA